MGEIVPSLTFAHRWQGVKNSKFRNSQKTWWAMTSQIHTFSRFQTIDDELRYAQHQADKQNSIATAWARFSHLLLRALHVEILLLRVLEIWANLQGPMHWSANPQLRNSTPISSTVMKKSEPTVRQLHSQIHHADLARLMQQLWISIDVTRISTSMQTYSFERNPRTAYVNLKL